ncbi:MAG TPA: winged helix-turn-helix transcriptional regulator [Phototrophicaceae bacterium]|nr:winged helix-turn-helix transcriptional regulator [Phototrophicaceae bacterium]
MDSDVLNMVYLFIRDYIRQRGFAPSIRNIADGCYMSPGNVHRYLDRLEWKGYITRQPGVARSIRLVADDSTPPQTDKRPH